MQQPDSIACRNYLPLQGAKAVEVKMAQDLGGLGHRAPVCSSRSTQLGLMTASASALVGLRDLDIWSFVVLTNFRWKTLRS